MSDFAATRSEEAPRGDALAARRIDVAYTGAGIGGWVDRQAGRIMLLPAVLILLAFAIFPLTVSAYLTTVRFALAPGGFKLTFIGAKNFERLTLGAQQYHFLGTFKPLGLLLWIIFAAVVLALLYWLAAFLRSGKATAIGFIGRLITSILLAGLSLLTLASIFAGGVPGTLVNTLFYVVVGVTIQFLLGLGLALLCARQIRGRNFFRVVFFIPLTVTPVGIAYTFRMLADMQKGPFAPISRFLGFGEWAWATDPWSARLIVLLGDTWQWTPFMFIVLLAAVESRPHDQVEAASIDGANGWQTFRHITWPAIAPIGATVVLIRLIEAFKIVDLPNVLTNGGPGLATESMTLHAFIAWRTQDLGGSAAIGYILLFVATITCISFFNFAVRPARMHQG
jgi:multiple sugar transport system permease protein